MQQSENKALLGPRSVSDQQQQQQQQQDNAKPQFAKPEKDRDKQRRVVALSHCFIRRLMSKRVRFTRPSSMI